MATNATNLNGWPNYIQVTPGTVTVSPVGFPSQTVPGTPVPPSQQTGRKVEADTCACCDNSAEDCTCSEQCMTCSCGGRPGSYAPLTNADPEADEENTVVASGGKSRREPATIDFGFKSDPQEVDLDGQLGLICEGFASKYNEADAVGEEQLPGAFRSFGEEWFAQKEPLLLFQHGMDAALGARPIGRGLSYKMLPDGVYVKVFVPKDSAEGWQDKRAKKRFTEVYNGIKSGLIRGFSVGGAFTRFGKKLANWATVELSITPAPCLASATFALGSKAVIDRYGAVPMGLGDDLPQEQSVLGRLTRKRWSSAMGFAKQDGDHGMHDFLLGYEPALQGKHDSEDCTLCQDRRDMMGVKMDGTGAKATTKSEGDGSHPASHYLVVEDAAHPSTWHLRVRGTDGKPDHRLMAAARAALTSNYRGQSYQGPNKAEALSKLKALYKSEGMEWDDSGSGGKSDDLDTSTVLQQATDFLADFGRSVKAGRRHSRETQQAVKFVIDHLTSTFGLGESTGKDSDGDNDGDNDGD